MLGGNIVLIGKGWELLGYSSGEVFRIKGEVLGDEFVTGVEVVVVTSFFPHA